MNEQDLFILADTTLLGVINQIHSDQWTMTMPPDFPTWDPNATITLREVINYHAYDEAWVPDTLSGKTIEEVGKAHDGDLLGDDPKQSFTRHVEAAVAAVRNLDDLDRVVHLSYAGAGHLIGKAYLPAGSTRVAGGRLETGGTPQANAAAQADAWPQVLRFLEAALR